VLLEESSEIAEFTGLGLQDVREVVGAGGVIGTTLCLHGLLDALTQLEQLLLIALALSPHLIKLCLE